MSLKLSDQIDDFFVDNMINLMNSDQGINTSNISLTRKSASYIDKLPVDQYFPYKQTVNYDNLKIDAVGKYSITLPDKADMITKMILFYCRNITQNKLTITDATAGVGGNVLSFCKSGMNVNAVEIDTERFEYLKHNISQYGYNTALFNKDYLAIYETIKQDIIFIDPPWGGLSYKEADNVTLSLGNMPIEELCNNICNKKLAKITVLKLPYNYNLNYMKNAINSSFNMYKLKNILLVMIFNN
jgi:16S rRNA G966 N2-methylase RsmD